MTYLQEPHNFLMVKIREKSPLAFGKGREKLIILKYAQNILLSTEWKQKELFLRETILPDPNPHWIYLSLTNVEEGNTHLQSPLAFLFQLRKWKIAEKHSQKL